jgi:hypothetical protein
MVVAQRKCPKYLPTINNSLSLARGRMRLQRSIVKIVLELLKMDVRELILADSITATNNPRTPKKTSF